jgi:hypothetical protein
MAYIKRPIKTIRNIRLWIIELPNKKGYLKLEERSLKKKIS